MKLHTGLGLAAVILVVISFLVPLIGTFIAWVALICAAIAAFLGDKGLSIATVILAAIKFFISPSVWASWLVLLLPSTILLLLPIIAMIVAGRKASTAVE